jgi:hypothetical protein
MLLGDLSGALHTRTEAGKNNLYTMKPLTLQTSANKLAGTHSTGSYVTFC